MNNIYVVTSGEYSDYEIQAVFSTREKAQEYVDTRNGPSGAGIFQHLEFEVEEYPLDPPIPEVITYCQVYMTKDGNGQVTAIPTILREDARLGFGGFAPAHPDIWKPELAISRNPQWRTACLVWHVETTDQERAVKVVNEKRSAILAAGIWGDAEKVHALIK